MCFCKNRSQLPGFLLSASLGILFSCSSAPSAPDAALRSLSADRILGHIRTLSSDEFEGRGPGSKGEQLTIKYLEDQYRSYGGDLTVGGFGVFRLIFGGLMEL